MTQTVIISQPFERAMTTLGEAVTRLFENGSVFVIFSTEYDGKGNVVHGFTELIEGAVALGYTYVNTAVYPTNNVQVVAFDDNVRYVIWLCKDKELVSVNREALGARLERSISMDRRKSGSFVIKHRDPGSVWIPHSGDGRARDSEHIILSDIEIIDCLRALSGCREDYELYVESVSVSSANTERYTAMDGAEVVLQDEFLSDPNRVYENVEKRVKELGQDGSLWMIADCTDIKRVSEVERLISRCKSEGLFYKGAIVLHEESSAVAAGNSLSSRHKYVLIFSKNENFYVDRNISESFCDYRNREINGKAFWRISGKKNTEMTVSERVRCMLEKISRQKNDKI